jgi:hypothetical protein
MSVLVEEVVCPSCWGEFDPADVVWISRHPGLMGDVRLGPDAQERFLPSRFDSRGFPLDARDQVCSEVACPHCHLALPRYFLEMRSLFVSVVGAPASGKSYFLGAAIHQLRSVTGERFKLGMLDADPERNTLILEYERALFQQRDLDTPRDVAELIRKTQFGATAAGTFAAVRHGGLVLHRPRPFSYRLETRPGHPAHVNQADDPQAQRANRILCVYDNAGESYLPTRQDPHAEEVTAHLAQARFILFVFDPLQDRRFLQEVEQVRGPIPPPKQITGQYEVLAEAARRVHQLRSGDRSAWPPLLILVSKWDAWHQLLPGVDMAEPLRQGSRAPVAGLDMERIESASDQLRALLLRLCPNLVQTAEAIGHEVRYLPVSALGKTPETRPGVHRSASSNGEPGLPVEFIRPRDIRPAWVTVPFLYGLARFVSKLIPKAERKPENRNSQVAPEKAVAAARTAPPPFEDGPPKPPRAESAPKTKPIEFDFNPEDLR